MRIHGDRSNPYFRPHTCPTCSRRFTTAGGLKQHITKSHEGIGVTHKFKPTFLIEIEFSMIVQSATVTCRDLVGRPTRKQIWREAARRVAHLLDAKGVKLSQSDRIQYVRLLHHFEALG